ncbi:hypothetical protein F2Q70_00003004 [Brassica cretica]|uniref:Uncharacterized protein n=1 Tax=Brassica cretica TaxID=69181 RepID=A0A8S9J111_BRACR|nr:hypothetical protein F2Q70_00003004 [Brassica cretica]
MKWAMRVRVALHIAPARNPGGACRGTADMTAAIIFISRSIPLPTNCVSAITSNHFSYGYNKWIHTETFEAESVDFAEETEDLAEKPDVRGGVMATSERCGEGDGGGDRRKTTMEVGRSGAVVKEMEATTGGIHTTLKGGRSGGLGLVSVLALLPLKLIVPHSKLALSRNPFQQAIDGVNKRFKSTKDGDLAKETKGSEEKSWAELRRGSSSASWPASRNINTYEKILRQLGQLAGL